MGCATAASADAQVKRFFERARRAGHLLNGFWLMPRSTASFYCPAGPLGETRGAPLYFFGPRGTTVPLDPILTSIQPVAARLLDKAGWLPPRVSPKTLNQIQLV